MKIPGITAGALAFALAIPSAFASGLSIPELQRIAADLSGLSISDEPACPTDTPATQTRVFLFEGASGYCPRYAHLNLEYDANGNNLASKLAATKETYENLRYLRQIRGTIGEEDQSRSCYLARNIEQYQDKLSPEARSRFRIIYYSNKGDADAAKCATQSLKPTSSVRLVGFSMGGYAAVQFAEALNEQKIPIEEALTIDPVGKNVLLVTGVFFTLDNPFIKRPPNAVHWQNFFEKIDTKSIFESFAFNIRARGSRVVEADKNQQIFPADFKTQWELDYPHLSINITQPVQAALADIFR